MINRTAILPVSSEQARVKIYVAWKYPKPEGEIRLYMRRIGDVADFAYYTPLAENGGELTFEFDSLLFSREPGRYEGRLEVGNEVFGKPQFVYNNATEVVGVANCV